MWTSLKSARTTSPAENSGPSPQNDEKEKHPYPKMQAVWVLLPIRPPLQQQTTSSIKLWRMSGSTRAKTPTWWSSPCLSTTTQPARASSWSWTYPPWSGTRNSSNSRPSTGREISHLRNSSSTSATGRRTVPTCRPIWAKLASSRWRAASWTSCWPWIGRSSSWRIADSPSLIY